MKSLLINVKGIKTHLTISHPKAQKTMVFLHGWGGSSESFEKIIEALPEDVRALCLDLPGFGKSAFPPIEGWTTHDYADWLYDLLVILVKDHQLTTQNTFYGHSFGCRVLIRFTQQHPRFVEKLILTGAAGIKWPKTLKQKTLSLGAKTLKPIISPTLFEKKSGMMGKVQRKALRLFGAHDWESCPEKLRPTLTKVLAEEDFRMDLKNIKAQTLLLWGAQDTYTPLKSAKVYHEYLPNNELVVFPEGRHGIHYTQAPEITQLVTDFL